MDQNLGGAPGAPAPQPGTPSPATSAPTNANSDAATAHTQAAASTTQQAINFGKAVLSNDTNTVNSMIQSGETHVVSLLLDLVPPTYRGKVQPYIDGIVNSTQGAMLNFADREIGIGLSIAKARLAGFLPFL